jgi:4-diphosphocytidyl-2-C-methyl-D-erythritol kinase
VTVRTGRPPRDPTERGTSELVASAKLTLKLRVRGRRPDGYHLLESEMVTVDLADSLRVAEGDSLTISSEFPGADTEPAGGGFDWRAISIPGGPDNLVVRALAAVGRTARVDLVKRIPPGAGLGGGSADAAAILRWAAATDVALAAELGADVPFCVTGGRAMVRGIGEVLTPLPYEERRFTLLLLPFGVDTGAVYRAWDGLVAAGGLPPAPATSNDLEAPALLVEPRLAQWREVFEQAAGRKSFLAGSGSTWFIEGGPDESGIGTRRSLRLGGETALLVPVRTTRPEA